MLAILGGGSLATAFGVRFMMTGSSMMALGSGLGLAWLCLGPGALRRFSADASSTIALTSSQGH